MKFHSTLSLLVACLVDKVSACRPPDPATWCFIEGDCGEKKGKICRTHPCITDPASWPLCIDFGECGGPPLTVQECLTGTRDSVIVCNHDTVEMDCDGTLTTVNRHPPTCEHSCDGGRRRERELQVEDPCILGFGSAGWGGTGPAGGGGSCVCIDDGAPFCAKPWRVMGNMVWMWRDGITLDGRGHPIRDGDGNIITVGPGDDKKLTMECDTGVAGEPHIKKWDGTWYDWHGECDAVMIHAPDFEHGEGLDIHIRTKIRYDYSYIETVATRIGDEIIEISAWGEYFINGVSQVPLPASFANRLVTHKMISEVDHKFVIDLGNGASLSVKSHKDVVSMGINTEGVDGSDFSDWFKNSTGLMGSFVTGKSLARDGVTVLDDPNAMGQEWQVRDSEDKLFQNPNREPQYPNICRLPSPNALQTRRRLGDTVPKEAAEKACSIWENEGAKERCLYDVMKTGDLGMAAEGTY